MWPHVTATEAVSERQHPPASERAEWIAQIARAQSLLGSLQTSTDTDAAAALYAAWYLSGAAEARAAAEGPLPTRGGLSALLSRCFADTGRDAVVVHELHGFVAVGAGVPDVDTVRTRIYLRPSLLDLEFTLEQLCPQLAVQPGSSSRSGWGRSLGSPAT